MPQVSVLMPVYNSEQFLEEAITSILNQTFKDFEFLILDDASSDTSFAIIKKYEKKDKRICLLQNFKNQGEGYCRSKLIENAKADLIAWMDADDISLKHRLKRQVDFMKKNPEVSVVSSRVEIFGNAKYTTKVITSDFSIKSALLIYNPIAGQSSMVKKSAQKYPYNKKVRIGPDYLYWIDNIKNFHYDNLSLVLYKYRDHPQSLIKTTNIPYEFLFPMMKEHLKKFSIFLDKEIFYTILGVNQKMSFVSIKKSWKIIKKIIAIDNFYGYKGVDRNIILTLYFRNVLLGSNLSVKELCQLFLSDKIKKKVAIYIVYKIYKFGLKRKIIFYKNYFKKK